jgi:hypothetical protein
VTGVDEMARSRRVMSANPTGSSCFPPPPTTIMEDLKAQLSSLLKKPQAKPSLFSLNNDLLQNPKVVAAVLGLLLILSIVFCKLLYCFGDKRL